MTIVRRFARLDAKPRLVTRADGTKMVAGYGAVFWRAGVPGTEYELWPGLVERIRPTAFDRALSELQDVRGLFNHNPSSLLGRTASSTMRLRVDDIGLYYEIDYADTQVYRDLAVHLERGDITGSSFGFNPKRRAFESIDERTEIMWVEDLDLYDVGPVTYPAYQATSAEMRSADDEPAKQAHAAWRAQQQKSLREAEAVNVRLRLVSLNNG